ncbi:hypothetical protein [Shimia biformata]|uniref:hypothetical protein n=1 Tax=Shimia biformata TaxID=1294299 RepID=UPI001950E702|nr:hypothetical protein [Shimia biformata]
MKASSLALALLATTSVEAGQWDITLAPYLWLEMPSAKTVLAESGSDVRLQTVTQLEAVASNGDWSLVGDINYLRAVDQVFGASELEVTGASAAVGVLREISNGPMHVMTAGIGLRHFDLAIKLRTPSGNLRADKLLLTPFIGVRGRYDLGKHMSVEGSLGIGGLGRGADFYSDLRAGVGFKTGRSSSVQLGYRHVFVDLDKSTFVSSFTLEGPYVAYVHKF